MPMTTSLKMEYLISIVNDLPSFLRMPVKSPLS
eukprot:CAMPEP_0118636324 /NCGR_PEP_ID=MMETSP0785-20121206/2559_1 /TAXON_ID=91992 /ORGANISM="Bolidomonas pacifica, Strain CCMP 1866" /LENGTH=32 /DNA_ID= /DNA_START= /DNA_END= /DNA_ORIENTATION=